MPDLSGHDPSERLWALNQLSRQEYFAQDILDRIDQAQWTIEDMGLETSLEIWRNGGCGIHVVDVLHDAIMEINRLRETLHLMASPANAKALDEAITELEAGRGVRMPKVTISFERRPDGGLRVWSDELPGLVLSHSDARAVLADIGPALQNIWLDHTPNAATIAALEAADRGEVVTVGSIEELFEELHRED
jgi:hypothetical protein